MNILSGWVLVPAATQPTYTKTIDGTKYGYITNGASRRFFIFQDGHRDYLETIPLWIKDDIANADHIKVDNMQVNESVGVVKVEKNIQLVKDMDAIATQYGIPLELVNLYFCKINGALYIKNPGLLFLAGKKGYGSICVTDEYIESTKEWIALCKIMPKITPDMIDSISKLTSSLQKYALDQLLTPTNGIGRASIDNVKAKSPQITFMREMAQTRAQNRALRAYTGYGGVSIEELE